MSVDSLCKCMTDDRVFLVCQINDFCSLTKNSLVPNTDWASSQELILLSRHGASFLYQNEQSVE